MGVSPPNNCYLFKMDYIKMNGKEKIYANKERNRYYTWDYLHGEMEVYNKQGYHIGVLDSNGISIKSAVKGRKINV